MITVKNLMQTSVQSSPDGQHWEPALPQYVGLRVRLSDAWAVLMGKATAVRQTSQADVFYGDRIVLPENPKDPLIVIKGGMNPGATQPASVQGHVPIGSIQHLKVMMEEGAFEGRLELFDALKNIDEFYAAPNEAQPAAPLTDKQLLEILVGIDPETKRLPSGFKAFARAIEAVHGITKGQE